ncbi:hypothetical protein GUJ93_ZPchr0011g27585 [Zizania palustris]|uniref:Rx N-terminal domain-containing protein n=1 Tax=Zizania palustris TaxID=103762 RepID=A0A8J5WJK0_ZIZPA|nr:hypothetical protein GUJ93_ZPchr0011g27585 [Zizania palustris]
MADLAMGAVTKLLGAIGNEALVLGRVKGDVQFIKEEMESINSFLLRLARTAPGGVGGPEDEQVRTWMKQVRDLAHDCSNCIDLYLQHGDPAVHRAARGGLWRYLWRVSWFLQGVVAKHKAVNTLGELKERARAVSERRSRYDVKVPDEVGAGPTAAGRRPSQAAAAFAPTEEDDDDGGQSQATSLPGRSGRRRRALDEYCGQKLSSWLDLQLQPQQSMLPSSIAFVAPNADSSGDLARQVLDQRVKGKHFDRSVWINLPEVHSEDDLPLLTSEILCYILQSCELQATSDGAEKKKKQQQQNTDTISAAFSYRCDAMHKTWDMVEKSHAAGRIEEIKSKIEPIEKDWSKNKSDKLLAMLCQALKLSMGWPDWGMSVSREQMIEEAAFMLQCHMEAVDDELPIILHRTQYQGILQKVFPASNKAQEAIASSAPAVVVFSDELIKEIKEIAHSIRQLLPKPQLPEDDSDSKEQAATPPTDGETGTGITSKDVTTVADIEEAESRLYEIGGLMENELFIKGIVDRISKYLAYERTLIVLQDDKNFVSNWLETINALGLVGCSPGSAVIVTTKNNSIQRAKELCCPPGEPVTYSLVGLYYDMVLQLMRERKNNNKQKQDDGISYDHETLHAILDRCDPHEFAMRVFVHDLYTNPDRSNEDLINLLGKLDSVGASSSSSSSIANTIMIKFCYNNLPRDYMTCLLHLAIFPQGHSIRRSTAVGRWVTEGLITKQDWPSAVHHAERCFDALIDTCLVQPDGVGDTGKTKSCIVDDLAYEFITKKARKEHFLDARLSHDWARHFSVFSEIRLGASIGIQNFVRKIYKNAPQLPLIKGLDLEGCKWFKKNHYLKNICNSILLLRYLSLRGTDVTCLPREINNLRELEILDIRETQVVASDTRDVLLLKLKRLLAGTSSDDDKCSSTVLIPSRIEKMVDMEVLSNVMASQRGAELKGIKYLCRLRKLGVVIQDKDDHHEKLLTVISDLKDTIQSLSITIHPTITKTEGTAPHPGNKQLSLRQNVEDCLLRRSKSLESLSIKGETHRVDDLLPFFTQNATRLAKVTLNRTQLSQERLNKFADLSKLRCVRLQHKAYTSPKLTFNKEKFQHLRCLLIDDLQTTDTIDFEDGAAPELEKMALSSTSIKYLNGAGGLPKLKELELKGNKFLLSLLEDDKAAAHTDDQLCTATTNSLLAFRKEEFKHLELLLIDAQLDTDIIFEDGAAPELWKIILLNLENISSLHGVSHLPRLSELELKGNNKIILLSLLEQKNTDLVSKVTLHGTKVKKDDLQVLAKKQNMHCLVLLDESYEDEDSQLSFKKDEFPMLKLLIVNCRAIENISFTDGAAPKLQKITWTFNHMDSLSGIENLPKLKRLVFIGDYIPYQVMDDIKAHPTHIVLTHRAARQQQDDEDHDDTSSSFFSCFSKNCVGRC